MTVVVVTVETAATVVAGLRVFVLRWILPWSWMLEVLCGDR